MQTANHAITNISLKERLLNWFRLSTLPRIKLYRGYGHSNCLTIFGHVLQLTAFPRRKYRHGILRNSLALLRLFMVKPYPCVEVEMQWKGKKYRTETGDDGFFKFEWKDEEPFERGWHEVDVVALVDGKMIAAEKGSVYIPEDSQYIFISDIDDTFLISHSKDIRKRLQVLFTNNARSRKPFKDVVKHYQLLQQSKSAEGKPNPFFFVSSSEWNLYDYLVEFAAVNKLPKGVFLLSQLKTFSQMLNTGQNNHFTKFARISRIIEAYPNQRIVLLGDSSQQDPYIYQSIVQHFPKQVYAVYIRDVFDASKEKVSSVMQEIEATGTPCCFFQNSSEAILHSVKIGLIPAAEINIKTV